VTARLDALLRDGPFHLALRGAIRQRGLPLERLRCHLARRGSTIAVSTLSAWQQGKARPTSPRSLQIVAALEEILRLPHGALLDLLAHAGRTGWPDELPDLMPGFQVNDLEIVARYERVYVDRHRCAGRVRSHVVARARRDGVDRFFAHFYGEPETDVDQVTTTALAHCRLGREIRDPAAVLLVSELLFDHVLDAGDTWVFEFETRAPDTSPCTDFAHGIRGSEEHCLIEVRFHPGALPSGAHAFVQEDADEEPSRITKLVVHDAAVHHMQSRLTVPWTGIHWDWGKDS